ncbi:hypothetical protein E4U42_007469 [Claviceps africana]|uniref:Phosphatidate phosphatase APP1 catalytic domain-containing protein n=1 Tax=Claviceps africana TaxID=83212 RepID=A0A8K0NG39_9HYPO|nr:hypothetical protein E4U42_007469 [Claviceps africana]
MRAAGPPVTIRQAKRLDDGPRVWSLVWWLLKWQGCVGAVDRCDSFHGSHSSHSSYSSYSSHSFYDFYDFYSFCSFYSSCHFTGQRRRRRLRNPKTHKDDELAPFRFFSLLPSLRVHPRHPQSIVRYLFSYPRALRDRIRARYRQGLLHFHLETLPHVKHELQSRIYRRLVRRQRTRADRRSHLLDLVASHSRQILLRARVSRLPPKHVKASAREPLRPNKMPPLAGSAQGFGQDASDGSQDVGDRGERGYRRRRLAAMAGSLYRSGQQAVTDFRESYVQSRGRGLDDSGANESLHIPGAFPEVAIACGGSEQMVLFPSYAKKHVKRDWIQGARNQPVSDRPDQRSDDWWRPEWERHEDDKAVVDVDVRGWIYSPHVGPLTRRNRILIGLARQLSGISAPRTDPASSSNTSGESTPRGGGYAGGIAGEVGTQHRIHQAVHEQEKIAEKAAVIEKRGQEEKRVASAGGYSEPPMESNGLGNGAVDAAAGMSKPRHQHRRHGSHTPDSAPASPSLTARQPSSLGAGAGTGELTEAELAVANANLMARVAPFLTNPLVAMPVTIFFYNESQSQSKTVMTDDAGHFNVRAALHFVPTHVRVLANEKLSATQEVEITHPAGVSLISDIDDTVKRSNISSGAREIFRNTFVRNLQDLCIDGVREWYTDMHRMGVSVHYCSNSPWQLYPVLASFFKIAGLPPGSLHLKQYSGMLQGIFEPVAERKKTTLNRLMKDFPTRKFLLVGDSGEADLEVYTELALANPGRVLAIFIRDVTTPDKTTGFFDPAFDYAQRKTSSMTLDDGKLPSDHVRRRPGISRQNSLPTGTATTRGKESARTGPVMGTLIDFAEEPEEAQLDEAAALAQIRQQQSTLAQRSASSSSGAAEPSGARKPAPPRPAKPAALRSAPAPGKNVSATSGAKTDTLPPPPPKPRRPQGLGLAIPQPPRSTTPSASREQDARLLNGNAASRRQDPPPPPPLPRRRSGLKNLSPRLLGRGYPSNADVDYEPLPPSAAAPASALGPGYHRSGSRSSSTTPSGSPVLGAQGGVNKKLELWRRRLLRAHELLHGRGIALYTWRTGHDVADEAAELVRRAQEEMRI